MLPERIIYTDASDHAGAGHCLQILGKIVHRRWTEEASRRSSTWRELQATELKLDAFKVELEECGVHLHAICLPIITTIR